MEFLPQPLGTTCTEQQHCLMACGQGRDFFLLGVPWHNVCTEQALSSHRPAITLPTTSAFPIAFYKLVCKTQPFDTYLKGLCKATERAMRSSLRKSSRLLSTEVHMGKDKRYWSSRDYQVLRAWLAPGAATFTVAMMQLKLVRLHVLHSKLFATVQHRPHLSHNPYSNHLGNHQKPKKNCKRHQLIGLLKFDE